MSVKPMNLAVGVITLTIRVVTGSTDGIGKEYARQLAKNGMNIVLISRTMEKLQKVSAEIVEESGVEIEIVQADFLDGRIIYDDIAKHLENKEIGILVNNVGVMLPNPMDFRYVADREIWSHVNVNVASVPAMTKLVLPSMISRGKGAIINIASIAASGPIPLMGIYAASKTFVDYFSQALEWECRGTGITVQTVNPGYVSTNMTSMSDLIHRPSILIPTARTFVTHSLSTLGYTARTSGYWVHGIQTHFVQNFISTWVFKYCMYLFNCLIVKNLKKNQENAATESGNTPAELRNTQGETNIQAEPKDVPSESRNIAEEPRSTPVEPRSSPNEQRNSPEELKNAPTEQRTVPAEPGSTGHDLEKTEEESR
ncbi:inactive hydroxysteroid dehydrogenase-like protein 1 isoform X2 [Macrobrachium rosenbergii]|uniref:inactive hydroxysteroid dehydrogenase-like protein 1 isoform X2 n=1 Tax=Macrobrachium rosenbergii TaxID=79674 RepID=UPI0034D58A29